MKRQIMFWFSVWCLASGLVDLDWMIVAPRFNSWYFSVDYWEFCPFIRINWYLAYFITVLRVVFGAAALSYIVDTRGNRND